jgi:hypothetical protein
MYIIRSPRHTKQNPKKKKKKKRKKKEEEEMCLQLAVLF